MHTASPEFFAANSIQLCPQLWNWKETDLEEVHGRRLVNLKSIHAYVIRKYCSLHIGEMVFVFIFRFFKYCKTLSRCDCSYCLLLGSGNVWKSLPVLCRHLPVNSHQHYLVASRFSARWYQTLFRFFLISATSFSHASLKTLLFFSSLFAPLESVQSWPQTILLFALMSAALFSNAIFSTLWFFVFSLPEPLITDAVSSVHSTAN